MKSKNVFAILAIVFLLISLSFALYPSISDFINKIFNESTITEYTNYVNTLDVDYKGEMLQAAKDYNEQVATRVVSEDEFSFNNSDAYTSILDVDGSGQIGSIEIPKINVNLPIYHGTNEKVLEKGAAHLSTSSFPIGGENANSVISAHTAFPTQKFFDDLTELVCGDVFYIKVLDDVLEYKVDKITIVEPEDTAQLQVYKGKDYVTLVTCYPYAVNTHRLFVRGERVPCDMTKTQRDKNVVIKKYEINFSLYFVLLGLCTISFALLKIILFKRKRIKRRIEKPLNFIK